MGTLHTFILTGFVACSLGAMACLFLLWRNEKVYDFRMDLIEEAKRCVRSGGEELAAVQWFESLPTYSQMVCRVWVWPLSKFVKVRCADYIKAKPPTGDGANNA